MQENQFSAGIIKGKEQTWQELKVLQGLEVATPRSNLNSISAKLCKVCPHSIYKWLIVRGHPTVGLAFHLKGLRFRV
jgi:hypothetical protein